ncbi:MAG TPA: outer membrane protein assembly factor BamD [Burkholderiaceae bacterium]|nr:outer membrane protein assembly factor BamD [Burkholderiaceae bacterium]
MIRSNAPRRHRIAALTATAVLVALLAGCNTTPKDPESQWSAERLYAEAKEESSQGNYERAGKLYERLEGRASGTALAQQAQIERAYMLYKGNDKPQALSTLERFIKLHPSSAAVDYALYLQGLINFNDNLGLLGSLSRQDLSERDQQAARDSYQSFKQLVDQFPQSLYADDARARMNYIVNSLAAYELHVARYYYRRGAYIAAANRAQTVVTDFQQSPSAHEALTIMTDSYDKLGLTELRDDANRVLLKNFPSGAAASGGYGTKKPWWQLW